MSDVTIEVNKSMVPEVQSAWTWRVVDPSVSLDAVGWEPSERQAQAVARAVVRTRFIESGIVEPSPELMDRLRAALGLPAVEVPDDG